MLSRRSLHASTLWNTGASPGRGVLCGFGSAWINRISSSRTASLCPRMMGQLSPSRSMTSSRVFSFSSKLEQAGSPDEPLASHSGSKRMGCRATCSRIEAKSAGRLHHRRQRSRVDRSRSPKKSRDSEAIRASAGADSHDSSCAARALGCEIHEVGMLFVGCLRNDQQTQLGSLTKLLRIIAQPVHICANVIPRTCSEIAVSGNKPWGTTDGAFLVAGPLSGTMGFLSE